MGILIDIFKESILIDRFDAIDNQAIMQEIVVMQEAGQGGIEHGYWRSPTFTGSTQGELGKLEKIVALAVQQYSELSGIGLRPIIDEFWVQDYRNGGYMVPHTHPVALFSAVYYPRASQNCSKIRLNRYNESVLSFVNAKFRPITGAATKQWHEIAPAPGMLVIFPGWMSHSVEGVKEGEERTVVAFNYKSTDKGVVQSWEKYDTNRHD